jgi:hypothetical protein
MSFIDKVKQATHFSIIDEFGGKGRADRITYFYIVLKLIDENGEVVTLNDSDVSSAVGNGNITISNYIGDAEYSIAILENNPGKSQFVISTVNSNSAGFSFIKVKVTEYFNIDSSISVKFKDGNVEFLSTCYSSYFSSFAYLSRKTE